MKYHSFERDAEPSADETIIDIKLCDVWHHFKDIATLGLEKSKEVRFFAHVQHVHEGFIAFLSYQCMY